MILKHTQEYSPKTRINFPILFHKFRYEILRVSFYIILMFRFVQLTRQFMSNKFTGNGVEFQNFAGFGKLTLNRPKALNSLNQEMLIDLTKLIPEIQKTKAFWMEGAGGKAFCAGGDVKSIYLNKESGPSFFRTQFNCDYKFSRLKSVQISNWDGIVMGGGVGISAHSPFRIATERTIFAMPENKLGFFTDVASGFVLSRLRNRIGYYIGATGVQLKGQDVYNSGLANYYVLSSNIPKLFEQLKNAIPSANNPTQVIQKILFNYSELKQPKKLANEQHINELFNSSNSKELLQKIESSPNNTFYQEVKKMLEGQSPLSINVTLQNIQKSHSKNLKQCFESDFNIVGHFLQGADFYEGIRCILIDKGSKPTWTFKSLKDVPQEEIKKFFTPLPSQKQLNLE